MFPRGNVSERHSSSQSPDSGDKAASHTQTEKSSYNLNLTEPGFNRDYIKATGYGNSTAPLNNLTLVNDSGSSERPATRDVSPSTDNNAASAVNRFVDAGTTPTFQTDIKNAFNQTFNHLNPETQNKLKDLQVITANQTKDVIPKLQDAPAVTPSPRAGLGQVMVFSETAIKNEHEKVNDVMNHEFFHAVDNVTGASKDPELRKAIDEGIRKLPEADQRRLAEHSADMSQNTLYSELSGDVMAMEMGSKQNDLAYVAQLTNAYGNFSRARELIRQKYLK